MTKRQVSRIVNLASRVTLDTMSSVHASILLKSETKREELKEAEANKSKCSSARIPRIATKQRITHLKVTILKNKMISSIS